MGPYCFNFQVIELVNMDTYWMEAHFSNVKFFESTTKRRHVSRTDLCDLRIKRYMCENREQQLLHFKNNLFQLYFQLSIFRDTIRLSNKDGKHKYFNKWIKLNQTWTANNFIFKPPKKAILILQLFFVDWKRNQKLLLCSMKIPN